MKKIFDRNNLLFFLNTTDWFVHSWNWTLKFYFYIVNTNNYRNLNLYFSNLVKSSDFSLKRIIFYWSPASQFNFFLSLFFYYLIVFLIGLDEELILAFIIIIFIYIFYNKVLKLITLYIENQIKDVRNNLLNNFLTYKFKISFFKIYFESVINLISNLRYIIVYFLFIYISLILKFINYIESYSNNLFNLIIKNFLNFERLLFQLGNLSLVFSIFKNKFFFNLVKENFLSFPNIDNLPFELVNSNSLDWYVVFYFNYNLPTLIFNSNLDSNLKIYLLFKFLFSN